MRTHGGRRLSRRPAPRACVAVVLLVARGSFDAFVGAVRRREPAPTLTPETVNATLGNVSSGDGVPESRRVGRDDWMPLAIEPVNIYGTSTVSSNEANVLKCFRRSC
jgi:hypothetical protein